MVVVLRLCHLKRATFRWHRWQLAQHNRLGGLLYQAGLARCGIVFPERRPAYTSQYRIGETKAAARIGNTGAASVTISGEKESFVIYFRPCSLCLIRKATIQYNGESGPETHSGTTVCLRIFYWGGPWCRFRSGAIIESLDEY